MKKRITKLVMFMLLSVVAIDAYSQKEPMSFRINVGANLSNFRNYKPENGYANTDKMPGLQLSALFDLPLSNAFSIQTGLGIMAKGGQLTFDEGTTWLTKNIRSSTTNVQLPLYVAYKVPVGEVKVLTFAGPYVELGISGTMKNKHEQLTPTAPPGQSLPDDTTDDFFGGEYFSRKNFGVDVGLGVEYRQFVVNVGYDFGLRDFNVHPSEKAYNRSIFMTVGYSFILK